MYQFMTLALTVSGYTETDSVQPGLGEDYLLTVSSFDL